MLMAWSDRLTQASYTAPSGTTFIFEYEDVSRSANKKVGAFNFPLLDGTYYQDLGSEGGRYPLLIYLSGANYDLLADQFFDALCERGPGILNHPRYGKRNVLPLSVKQEDRLVSSANQAIFNVDFAETIEDVNITAQDPLSVVDDNIEDLKEQTGNDFEDLFGIVDGDTLASFKSQVDDVVNKIDDTLRDLMEDSSSFTAAISEISNNIDDLINYPSTLINQLSNIILMPAREIGNSYRNILAGYSELTRQINNAIDLDRIENLLGVGHGNTSVVNESYAQSNLNSVQMSQTLALTAISAISRAAVEFASNDLLQTRKNAINLASDINDLWDETRSFYDTTQNLFIGVGSLDYEWQQNDGVIENVDSSVKFSVGNLRDVSYSLYQERRITTDTETNIILLAAKYYKDVSNASLDKVINYNSLAGEEILLVPANKELVFYV